MESLSKAELAKQVKSLFTEMGPLCDSEGFYNHTGECWNDTLQMIFLNSDICKESVQRKLALGEIDPFEVETIFESVLEKMFIPQEVKEDFIRKWIGLITLYLETLQNRFRRHYYTESLRLEKATKGAKNACSLEDAKGDKALKEMLKLAMLYRTKGKEGPLSAFAGQSFTKYGLNVQRDPKKIWNIYESGGETSSKENVDMIFKHYFSIPFTKVNYKKESKAPYLYQDDKKNIFSLKDSVFAVYIGSHTIRQENSGHASCFYTCGNREYFFDDNNGSIQFPWKRMLNILSENQRKDILINIYFDGSLKIVDPSGKNLLNYEGYPILAISRIGAKKGSKNRNTYETFLWDGTEIVVDIDKKSLEEFIYEKKMGENTLTVQFKRGVNATDMLSTYELEKQDFVKGRANEQTGYFIGSRLNQDKDKILEIKLDEQLEKVAAGGATIDDFFYEGKDEKYNPLLLALHLNSLDYVQKILEMGADIKVRGTNNDSVVFFAIAENVDVDILELLVKKGADVNDNNSLASGYTPLIGAMIFYEEDEGEDVVKFLLEKGANVNIESKKGATAIEYALVLNRYENILQVLEEHGAERPKCPTKEKLLAENLLIKALEKENLIQAGLLGKCYRELELFEEINRENLVGDTPLKVLLRIPYSNWTKRLFTIFTRIGGADVNHIDRFGGTPLHYAISLNNLKWVKLLIKEGARSNVIVRGLGSPLDFAKRMGNPEIIKVVEEEDSKNPLAYVMAIPKTLKPTSFTFRRRNVKKAANMPKPQMGGRKTRRRRY
jgi:ankyrin repeat protein